MDGRASGAYVERLMDESVANLSGLTEPSFNAPRELSWSRLFEAEDVG